MSAWGARIAVVAVFALGVVCGGAAVHLRTLKLQESIARDPAPLARLMVMHLDRDLGLSAEQERRVREIILELRHETVRDMRHDLLPKVRDVFERGSARVDEVLTEEQRERFRPLVEERRRMLEELGADPPPTARP